ncbi:proline-specific peptidase [Guyanagaster necrorhizus]|uniref:Proline-specific peptidase n=1 Tax=Guyanagaster necrorhizus TaxID=856835 RepID=A0A9P8ATM5_9AGAR|nr:proline-specific peptidase [Guyanagaster necrorhizus MCA 3950]KAG7447365.1 proline-specific peptidase [Guyanagaster necrorhizus MCA 3950]
MPLETTGTADFKVGDETYQTWYKIVGDLKSGKPPLVTLHGGPGFTHEYMLVHKALTESAGIPIVAYDQIGNGNSTHLRDAPKEFWTPEFFMDELDNLLDHLGISECFDLVGQSWGGMLAGQYAATRSPKGLRRLVILNSPASMELYEVGTNALLEKFPPDFVAMLRKHEREGTTSSKEYEDGMMVFMKKHVCTLDPWPEDVMASFESFGKNPTVFHTMLGPSEFNVTGTLKTWSIVDILHKITNPTLIVSAPNDEVQNVAVMPWFLRVPKIKWLELANSTHLGLYEEKDRYLQVLEEFLEASG